ncbi:MAG: universal stress protein [Burkholderiaceae bacterium]|nr:universal stress protein [Burkholderiaceae bacterium]
MYKNILVPTDGSPLSQEAVAHAISFARDAGARIIFFCAGQANPATYSGVGAIFDAQFTNKFRETARATAQEILDVAKKLAQEAGVECDTMVLLSGAPWEGIIEAAKRSECDLIFMASHGRRGVDALLLGSQAQKVLVYSKIPVLVYR